METINSFKDVNQLKDIKIAVEAQSLEELFDLVKNAEMIGFNNLLLKLNNKNIGELLSNNITLRRLAIAKNLN